MAKLKNILSLVVRILTIVALASVSLISLATAYIMFAPDNLPKPFYLSYIYPTPIPGTMVQVTPAPTPTPVLKPGEGLMVNSSTKIINLADPSGRKYIRVTMVFEFAPPDPTYFEMTPDEKAAYLTAFNTEITAKMPVIDDAVITLLSTKTFDALYTAAGKEGVRQEILQLVRARLPEYDLLSVYFTEFVVQ